MDIDLSLYPFNFISYVTRGIIWGQRQFFCKVLKGLTDHSLMPLHYQGVEANEAIARLLSTGRPCLVSRFGSVKIDAVLRGYDIDFDIAILGCGAYGMSLGAFIKDKLHRQAVHLGGVSQLLFGIKGGRWDAMSEFQALYNDSWTRPLDSERPVQYKAHEGGAYW